MNSLEESLKYLRDNGWSVAVHNDYFLDGVPMTFWLFTNAESGRFAKGEGLTDIDALADVREDIAAHRVEFE